MKSPRCRALRGRPGRDVGQSEGYRQRLEAPARGAWPTAEGTIAGGVFREPSSHPARLKNLCMRGVSRRENREVPRSPACDGGSRVVRGGRDRNPVMHDRGKSDDPVVPAKSPNNTQGGAAEVVEGRGPPKGHASARPEHAFDDAPRRLPRIDVGSHAITTACSVRGTTLRRTRASALRSRCPMPSRRLGQQSLTSSSRRCSGTDLGNSRPSDLITAATAEQWSPLRTQATGISPEATSWSDQHPWSRRGDGAASLRSLSPDASARCCPARASSGRRSGVREAANSRAVRNERPPTSTSGRLRERPLRFLSEAGPELPARWSDGHTDPPAMRALIAVPARAGYGSCDGGRAPDCKCCRAAPWSITAIRRGRRLCRCSSLPSPLRAHG